MGKCTLAGSPLRDQYGDGQSTRCGFNFCFTVSCHKRRQGCIRDLEKETVGTLSKGEAINNKSWDYSSNAGLIWVTNIYKGLCSYASIKISPSYPLPLSTTGFPLPQTWIGARASLWDVINTWLASLCGTHFESTLWRKVNLNILLCWLFKETFENVHSGEKSNKWNKQCLSSMMCVIVRSDQHLISFSLRDPFLRAHSGEKLNILLCWQFEETYWRMYAVEKSQRNGTNNACQACASLWDLINTSLASLHRTQSQPLSHSLSLLPHRMFSPHKNIHLEKGWLTGYRGLIEVRTQTQNHFGPVSY